MHCIQTSSYNRAVLEAGKEQELGLCFLGMVQMNLTVPQAPERPSPVILSEAKDLAASRERPFASLRVTLCDWSNCQAQFIQIEPCLNKLIRPPVGADLSRPPPIYRPKGGSKILRLFCKTA